jgi:hypothetical protein
VAALRRWARLGLGLTALAACGGNAPIEATASCRPLPPFSDPFPAPLLDDSGLFDTRFGALRFDARDGTRLSAATYRATGFDPVAGPIWFVMHGAERAADLYLAAAAPVAERHGALAIAIRFSRHDYPTGDSYTLGVKKSGSLYTGVYDPTRWRDVHDTSYAEVEHLFEAVRKALGSAQQGYTLLGHSAGAQFTHRLLTFLPHTRVQAAVAANAGWYTMPSRGGGRDPDFFMPYGLQGSPLDDADLCPLVTAPLTLLLGSRDTATPDQDGQLRGKAQAMAQGATRLARGQSYFAAGRARAEALRAPFGWRLAVVPGARHEIGEVMPSAGFFLFGPGGPPCAPSSAAEASGLVIAEVQADPPDGRAGDTNADGVRDADADEFVELVNTGATPLCLAGWTLGDAADSERHRFPLGRTLPPGGALVVFGGGLPTGSFGGAEVQWAAFGGTLGLSDAGDVLSLRDSQGTLLRQLSWGNCDGAACAGEPLKRSLGIRGAVLRWPEPSGSWTLHRDVAATNSSPGTRADGTPW